MTEINNIPKHWLVKKLGDVCKTKSGGTPSRRNKSYYEGNIPWVKSGELNKGLITDTEEKISEDAIRNSSAKKFLKGTLLIALYGATIGKLAFLGVDAATNQAVCGIFKNGNIDSNYLYYYLFSKKPSLVKQGIGGAQPNISQGILKNLELPIPPLSEQQAIVSKIDELLSDLENGKQQLLLAQQQLKIYRQSLLKWAFEGKLTNKNVKDGELPEGWKYSSLKELKKFSIYGPRFSSKDYSENGVAVLRTTDISEMGKVDWVNSPKLNLSDTEYEKYKLLKNDLLITRTGSIGRLSIFNDNNKAIPGAFLIHYRLIDELNIWYIFYFLKSQKAQNHFKKYSFGVGRPNLNVPNIELLKIPLPNIEEQQLIVDELESKLTVCDKIEETISQSLLQAESLKQSILKKAFEGRLLD